LGSAKWPSPHAEAEFGASAEVASAVKAVRARRAVRVVMVISCAVGGGALSSSPRDHTGFDTDFSAAFAPASILLCTQIDMPKD
jgi:hypothetical protein